MEHDQLRSGERARERGAEGQVTWVFINIFRHSPLPHPLPPSSSWGEGEDADRRPAASFVVYPTDSSVEAIFWFRKRLQGSRFMEHTHTHTHTYTSFMTA